MRAILVHTTITRKVFTYEVPGFGLVKWDIDRAIELAEAGQILTTLTMEREQQENCQRQNEWDEAKIPLVDPSVPGIAAPLVWEGATLYVLIDGQHRNVRCLREGIPFQVRLLTDDAARACVLLGDDRLMPWGQR